MKIFLLISIVIISAGSFYLFASNQPKVELKIGEVAPDFILEDQDGKKHKLSDYKGKKVVLYYFPKADTPG